jgi:hypothetical protein
MTTQVLDSVFQTLGTALFISRIQCNLYCVLLNFEDLTSYIFCGSIFYRFKNQTSKSIPENYKVIACTQNIYNFRIANVLCIIAFVTGVQWSKKNKLA